MFYIVEIEDESGLSVSVIPKAWMDDTGTSCLWPPVKNATRLVCSQKVPEANWKSYPARILKTYVSYMAARSALPTAELTSDLNTDQEDSPIQKRVSLPRKPYTPPIGKGQKRKLDDRSKLSDLPISPRVLDDEFEVCAENPSVPVFSLGQILEAEERDASDSANDGRNSDQLESFSQRQSVSDQVVNDVVIPEVSQSSISALNTTTLERLVRDIAAIKITVQNMDARMARMETAIYASTSGNFSLKETSYLLPKPFSRLEDFVSFDDSLTPEKDAELRNELKLCGGGSVTEATGRCLRKILTDDVGRRYSLWGKKNNLNFSKTRTWSAVKGTILSIRQIDPTEKSVEKASQEWFRHCADRLKNKKPAVA